MGIVIIASNYGPPFGGNSIESLKVLDATIEGIIDIRKV